MIHTVYIDQLLERARKAATGNDLPQVGLKIRTEQTIAFAFTASATVAAVEGWVSGKAVIKEKPTSPVLLIDAALDAAGTGASTRYNAVWTAATLDGPTDGALRQFMADSTQPKECWCEVEWIDAAGTHSASFPITLIPTFNDPEDETPDPAASASWDWLKEKLAAGSNITLAINDSTKVITITATGSAGGGADWGDIGGTLANQPDLAAALTAKLSAALAATTYQPIITDGALTIARTNGLQAALDAKLSAALAATTYQPIITDGALTIARTNGLQAALDTKLSAALAATTYQVIITDGALTIARTNGLQAALDAKLSSAAAAATYQAIITDGALTIARTNGLQTALDGKQAASANLATLAAGFGALFVAPGIIRWNGAGYQILTGGIPADAGGTGLSLYSLGDLLYSAGDLTALSKLAGNTTTTKKFLTQTGTGIVSAAPAWGTIQFADVQGAKVEIVVACSDETTALTVGAAKVTFRMPHAMTLSSVRLSVNAAPTGSVIIVDVKEAGTSIFSTKPQIAISAFTSVGGAVPGVISDTALADDAEITINLDQIGSTIAGKGLKVTLIGTRP